MPLPQQLLIQLCHDKLMDVFLENVTTYGYIFSLINTTV